MGGLSDPLFSWQPVVQINPPPSVKKIFMLSNFHDLDQVSKLSKEEKIILPRPMKMEAMKRLSVKVVE